MVDIAEKPYATHEGNQEQEVARDTKESVGRNINSWWLTEQY